MQLAECFEDFDEVLTSPGSDNIFLKRKPVAGKKNYIFRLVWEDKGFFLYPHSLKHKRF